MSIFVYNQLGFEYWDWSTYLLFIPFCTFLLLQLFAIITYIIIHIKGSRIHWIEIGEKYWCPQFLRQIMQFTLQTAWQFYGLNKKCGSLADSVANDIFKQLEKLECNSILDLCSGGCGPSAYLNYRINQKIKEISNKQQQTRNNKVVTVLSDLFPFQANWKQLVKQYKYITFCPTSVDATNVPLDDINKLLAHKQKICNMNVNNHNDNDIGNNDSSTKSIRLRTLFGSFHHFRPPQAIGILTDAIKSGDGFIMAELALNRNTLSDYLKVPVIHALAIPIEWIHLIIMYWSQPDRSIIGKIFDILIMFISTWLWYVILSYDGIISCGRMYLKSELIELSEKAMEKARKDVLIQNKEESIGEYEWNVVTKNSQMVSPFDEVMQYTLLIGMPKNAKMK